MAKKRNQYWLGKKRSPINRQRIAISKQLLIIDDNGRECSGCEVYKSWDNYHKDPNNLHGHSTRCSWCKTTEVLKCYYFRTGNDVALEKLMLDKPKPESAYWRKYKKLKWAKEQGIV